MSKNENEQNTNDNMEKAELRKQKIEIEAFSAWVDELIEEKNRWRSDYYCMLSKQTETEKETNKADKKYKKALKKIADNSTSPALWLVDIAEEALEEE